LPSLGRIMASLWPHLGCILASSWPSLGLLLTLLALSWHLWPYIGLLEDQYLELWF
jgi:hypothetical protein